MLSMVIGRTVRSTFACSSRMASPYDADDACLLVELAAALHAEALRHRDLDVLDVVAIPDRLEERVGEPEVEDVLHRLFAEVVVDAIDALLGEHAVQHAAELPRRSEVPPEGFLDDDAPVRGARSLPELGNDGGKHARGNGQVVRRPLRAGQQGFEPGERGGVGVVAVHVLELRRERFEALRVEAAVLGDALLRALEELLAAPPRLGHADDGKRQGPADGHGLERGEDFLVGEVSGRAEEDERVRSRSIVAHLVTLFPAPVARWASCSFAAATTISGWKPNLRCSSLSGAEAPNVRIPI